MSKVSPGLTSIGSLSVFPSIWNIGVVAIFFVLITVILFLYLYVTLKESCVAPNSILVLTLSITSSPNVLGSLSLFFSSKPNITKLLLIAGLTSNSSSSNKNPCSWN